MLRIRTPPTQQKALIWLAKNGHNIGWKIGKGADVSRSTIYVSLSALETKGLVISKRLTKDKKRKKNTKGETEYSLTRLGLIHAILALAPRKKLQSAPLNKINKHWADLLPLVLGKWQHFKDENVEDLALDALLKACHRIVEEYLPLIPAQERKALVITGEGIETAEELETRNLTDCFYHDQLIQRTKESERWMFACKKDSAIKAYLVPVMENYKRQAYHRQIVIEHNLTLMS